MDSKTVSKTIPKPDFDIDKFLMHLSLSLFDIDKYSRIILGVIAKHGPLNVLKISELGFRRSHNITRDIVRYRVHSSKNPANFIKSDFVIQQTGKNIGNIKSKKENIYHLLFKGFMASLSKTQFDECYLVKKYINLMPGWTSHYHLPYLAIQLIKFDLALFMLKYVMIGSRFNHLVDVDTNRESLNYEDPLTVPSFTPQTRNIRYDLILFDIRYWFHVYSQVIKKVLEKVAEEKEHTKEAKMAKNAEAYVNYWYQWLFRTQFSSSAFSPRRIPVEMMSQIMPVGRTINVGAINFTAKQILRNFGFKPKFKATETPTFFV